VGMETIGCCDLSHCPANKTQLNFALAPFVVQATV